MKFLTNAALLSAFLTLIAVPVNAQVEQQVAGKWYSQKVTGVPEAVFEIELDGRYQTKVKGQVVEAGTMTANDGKWSLRSDSGRVDNGSFTINGSALQLHGRTVTTSWTPNGVTSGSGTPSDTAIIRNGAGLPTWERAAAGQAARRRPTNNGGWLANPPGGYVPLRKDGQARKFWRGF